MRGKEDPTVIDHAVKRGCLIITVNKDFIHYYRNHAFRKGKNGTFFYGLIFLKPSKVVSRQVQLKIALKEIAWSETRQHDDLVFVSAEGKNKNINGSVIQNAQPRFPPSKPNGRRSLQRAG